LRLDRRAESDQTLGRPVIQALVASWRNVGEDAFELTEMRGGVTNKSKRVECIRSQSDL